MSATLTYRIIHQKDVAPSLPSHAPSHEWEVLREVFDEHDGGIRLTSADILELRAIVAATRPREREFADDSTYPDTTFGQLLRVLEETHAANPGKDDFYVLVKKEY